MKYDNNYYMIEGSSRVEIEKVTFEKVIGVTFDIVI